jgi:hypothetical protein
VTEARILHLMSMTNEVPLPHEEYHFRQDLDERRARVSVLDQQIEPLVNRLRILEEEVRKEKEEMRPCEAAVSPLRRFPNELVAEIFKFATGDPWKLRLLEGKFDSWAYGRVCSQWRSVVLSLPSAWNALILCCESASGSRPWDVPRSWTKHVLNQVLARSRDLPLYVSVDAGNTCWNEDHPPYFHSFIPTLFGHSQRFHELQVIHSCDNWLVSALSSLDGRIPNLQSLLLRDTPDHECVSPTMTAQLLSSFSNSPKLERVEWDVDIEFPEDGWDSDELWSLVLAEPSLPWSQLSHFRWTSRFTFTSTPQYKLLSKLQNLRHLCLSEYEEGFDPDAEEFYSKPLVRLPLVTSLESRYTPIIRLLDLPSLEVVKINDDVEPDDFHHLTARSPNLCCIELEVDRGHENLSQKILSVEPIQLSVTSLTIISQLEGRWVLEDFRKLVSSLTIRQQNGNKDTNKIVLPQLENLVLKLMWRNLESTDFDAIVNMIKSRWLPELEGLPLTRRLRRFQFVYHGWYGSDKWPPPQPDDLDLELSCINSAATASLRQLRDEGLDVRWEKKYIK